MHYNRLRYYRIDTGSYMETDKIKVWNYSAYSYVQNNPIRYLDPNGLWKEDVHSGIGINDYGTYKWSKEVGFSDADSKSIALGNASTDNYASWAPIVGVPSRHFDLAVGNKDSRDIHADEDIKLAVQLYKINKCNALKILGRGLHSIQDKYAHMRWKPLWIHPDWYDDADYRKKELARTREATYSYLLKFRELIFRDAK